MNLAVLADFQLVASHGSLGKASRASGRPKATLSRRVRQLEESLGVRLIERGQRALGLTAEGRALYERTLRPLHDIEEVGQSLAMDSDQPRGLLRVSGPLLFSGTFGGRLSAEFIARHPGLRMEWIASDQLVDLVHDGFDIAIRANPHPNSEWVGRCFASDTMQIVAPASLPMPDTGSAKDPAHVAAVTMTHLAELTPWQLRHGGKARHLLPDFRAQLSSLQMTLDAVRAGAGAAVLPRSLTRDDVASGRLALWDTYPGRAVDMWVLHSSRRLVSAKVAAFVQFMVESFPSKRL